MEKKEFLKIKIKKQQILIPLHYIFIVVYIPSLQKVPSNEPSFRGLLNYHGQSISVYCLTNAIFGEKSNYTLNTPLIICEVEKKLVGFFAEDVCEVISLSSKKIQDKLGKEILEFVSGIYKSESFSAWILDVKKIMKSINQKMEY